MGIYLPNMEMPEAGDHVLLLHVYHDGTASIIGDHRHYKNEPFEAVPVPPHGDLIDRAELAFEDDYYGWRDKKVVEAARTIIPADPAEEGER